MYDSKVVDQTVDNSNIIALCLLKYADLTVPTQLQQSDGNRLFNVQLSQHGI